MRGFLLPEWALAGAGQGKDRGFSSTLGGTVRRLDLMRLLRSLIKASRRIRASSAHFGVGGSRANSASSLSWAALTSALCGVAGGIWLRARNSLHMSRLCVRAGYWAQ